jgi:hypothetical protein
MIAYDSGHRQVVLFGGDTMVNAGIQSTAQTWIWNGANWSLYGGTSPSPRSYGAMDYDAARGQIVMYGGQYDAAGTSPVSFFDTWVWNGSTWANVTSTLMPKVRQPAGTFDSTRSVFTVFGMGANGPETWLWNGSQWDAAKPAHSPSGRQGEGMAFVASPKQVILFGGFASGLGYLNDTWLWNGTDWSSPTLSSVPPVRISPALFSGQHAVLFGGGGSRGPLGDAWSWDGSQWTQISSSHVPPAREAAAGASDGQFLLIVGGDGGGILADEWRWDGSDWQQC